MQTSMLRRSSRAGITMETRGCAAGGAGDTSRRSRDRRTRQIVMPGPTTHGDATSSESAVSVRVRTR
jgi:hypothetical protein